MTLRPMCYVSTAGGFIWMLIPKNASSSIRAVLGNDPYRAVMSPCDEVPNELWGRLPTFAFVRDPVERALSAYQETSLRAEVDAEYLPAATFVDMPEGTERFRLFLDQVERLPWDLHVAPQVDILRNRRINYWGRVDSVQQDLRRILSEIGLASPSRLGRFRSRSDVVESRHSRALNLDRSELDASTIERIRSIYRKDHLLYQGVAAAAGTAIPRLNGQGVVLGPNPASAGADLATRDR